MTSLGMTLYHPEGVEFNKNKTQRLIANSDVSSFVDVFSMYVMRNVSREIIMLCGMHINYHSSTERLLEGDKDSAQQPTQSFNQYANLVCAVNLFHHQHPYQRGFHSFELKWLR